MDFDTFLREVESEPLDIDLMQPQIDELEGRVKELNGERDTVIGQIKEANIELDKIAGGSKASEWSLQREGIASRLEERVQELARLRLAATVLHAAIEEYREKNQGPVLSRASEIFSRITRDSTARTVAIRMGSPAPSADIPSRSTTPSGPTSNQTSRCPCILTSTHRRRVYRTRASAKIASPGSMAH